MIRTLSSDRKESQAPVPPPPMTPPIQVVHETALSVLTDSKVGQGSFGIVTWGYAKLTGSPVAIKKIKDSLSAKAEVAAFRKELPHTPRLREEFENDQFHNIVMDHVDEKNIFHAYLTHRSNKKLSLCEIRSIAYQALEFLADLAEKNLIYNDLKPENMIWKKASNCLMIVDLASVRDAMNRGDCDDDPEQSILYVAPEILREEKATCYSDVWSLGCTLFEIIVKDPLFYQDSGFSDDPTEFILQQMEELKSKSEWQSKISIALQSQGAKPHDIDAWIKLISSMLSLKNRPAAKELLKSPILEGEIDVKLTADPKVRCTLQLQGISVDLHIDKNRCLHIPRSPNGSYILTLKNHSRELKIPLTLKSGDILDITPYQAELAKTDESSTKRAKTTSAK